MAAFEDINWDPNDPELKRYLSQFNNSANNINILKALRLPFRVVYYRKGITPDTLTSINYKKGKSGVGMVMHYLRSGDEYLVISTNAKGNSVFKKWRIGVSKVTSIIKDSEGLVVPILTSTEVKYLRSKGYDLFNDGNIRKI